MSATGDAAAATTGASVLGGGIWQMASRFLPQVYTLVISIAIARFLGPDDFGRQSFIAFVAISVISLFSGGLKVALMRFVGELLGRREGATIRGLVLWSGSIQLVGALLGGGALIAAGALGADPRAAWALAGIGAAVAIAQTVPNAVLLGAQRFRLTALIGMGTDTIAVPSTIAVLVAGGEIAGVFAVQAAVAGINLALTSAFARRALHEMSPAIAWPRGALADRRPAFLRYAALATAGVVLELIVWRRSEFFFLDRFSTDVEIGLYSVAFAAAYALALVPQTLAAVIAPAFATLHGAGHEGRLRSGYGRAMRLLLFLSLPMAAGALALGPEAIRLLYGEGFAGAGPVFLVMVVLFPLLPLQSVSQSMLVGLGRAVAPLAVGAAAAVVNIALDFALIPDLEAIGAALANTGAQLVVVIPITLYTIRLVGGITLYPGSVLRAAAAAAVAGLAAWGGLEALGGVAGLALGAVLGAASFSLLAAALRIMPTEDAAWLQRTAGERFGGSVGWACRHLARDALVGSGR